MNRLQLWACGGGRQSAAVAALILRGELPRPDHVNMCVLPKEKKTTFAYVNKYIRPAMKSLGIPFAYVPSVKYRTREYFGGEDGQTPLIPMYSNQSGEKSKLSEWCSGYWKRDVGTRWAAEQPGWKERGVDTWIGISWDERSRRRGPRAKWIQPVYPLLDMLPRPAHISYCLQVVEEIGWPPAPRSRCIMCPNQLDREWLELTPAEIEEAAQVEDEIRKVDLNAFLHKSLIPLRQVTFNSKEDSDNLFGGGCSAGMCL